MVWVQLDPVPVGPQNLPGSRKSASKQFLVLFLTSTSTHSPSQVFKFLIQFQLNLALFGHRLMVLRQVSGSI